MLFFKQARGQLGFEEGKGEKQVGMSLGVGCGSSVGDSVWMYKVFWWLGSMKLAVQNEGLTGLLQHEAGIRVSISGFRSMMGDISTHTVNYLVLCSKAVVGI